MGKTLKLFFLIMLIFSTVGCNKEMKTDGQNASNQNPSIEGNWKGEIKIPNQPLEILVEFKNEKTGAISIPAQGVEDFSLADIKKDGKDVSFSMPLPGQSIKFKGELKDKTMSGTFTQQGQHFPFHLEKTNKRESKADQENFLSVETPTGKLYGSLLTPDGGTKYPVALIIPGSGPTDRNGNSPALGGKNNSLKMLAEALKKHGIASVRYDKRGAGKNAQAVIPQKDMRFGQNVDDAKKWLDKLKQDERFSKVVVIGHSEGSLVGMLAAEKNNADAFISLAGAGHSIDQVLKQQLKASLPQDQYHKSESILGQLKQGETVNDVPGSLKSVFNPSVQPYYISWMKYDPAKEIRKLNLPALIINGKHDIQVPASEAETLKKAKPEAELLLVDKMNHVLKEAPAEREANLKTYTDPSLPLADGLESGMVEFLQKHNFKSEIIKKAAGQAGE
ncbi:alpha/beta hydrolase family protein [Fictibacillus fluitans]|uniref:Alpha/beta hydrolase n=1 Tax=Fictibacillus fluitans TaxID=3058422 RepID=A0ABT8I3U0_9BACL|nr:alpha/beta hydrolase [Fictibacillus sp. NE201]MDN4527682.1 alpha/beta hydrolase [Fictibacillus sp. NE201]